MNTIAGLGISAIVSIAAIITLIAFLATRELAGSGNSNLSARISRYAGVGILPLLIAFAAIVIIKIAELL